LAREHEAVERRQAERAPATQGALKPLPPIIDEIQVEKSEVCEGEENLVQVKAHTADGSDAFLRFVIAGQAGPSVPLKSYLLPDGEIPRRVITIFGRNGVSTSAPVPRFAIKRCAPDRALLLGYRVRANAIDEIEFTANVVHIDKALVSRPAQYRWNFGDGTTQVTSEPHVTHNYARREQRAMYSHYLVQAEARDEFGESLRGRASLEFLNLGFQDLQKLGVVSLEAQGMPRFPVLSPDGVVRQRFEIWHSYDQPVEIQRIHLLQLNSDGRRDDLGQDAEPSLLNRTDILPGESVEAELSFDTKGYPGALALVYQFEGTAADGRRALGQVSVMKPPPKPTRENSRPVRDPALAAKIKKAMTTLGQDAVTQEDLWKIERDERFATGEK